MPIYNASRSVATRLNQSAGPLRSTAGRSLSSPDVQQRTPLTSARSRNGKADASITGSPNAASPIHLQHHATHDTSQASPNRAASIRLQCRAIGKVLTGSHHLVSASQLNAGRPKPWLHFHSAAPQAAHAGRSCELHWHAVAAEWAYVIAGRCQTVVLDPSSQTEVNSYVPGDLWIFPKGHGHSI